MKSHQLTIFVVDLNDTIFSGINDQIGDVTWFNWFKQQ